MVYDEYTKKRIVAHYSAGLSNRDIVKALQQESIEVTKSGVWWCLRSYRKRGTVERKKGSGRQSIINSEVSTIVDDTLERDDETTGAELTKILEEKGHKVSTSTALRCRQKLGWTSRGSAYCQLIREPNKLKRYDWATLNEHEDFDNVIFTDECSVQLETHRRHACRRVGKAPRPKPRAKHPTKVHVWARISCRGATSILIFDGIMDAVGYGRIVKEGLVPFIRKVYPDGHRLMQDNDPKHTSRYIQEVFEEEGINWWKTPPESPDCNPIENLWHELKEFLRREIKPTIKRELVEGIERFWEGVSVDKCKKYIGHLKKVLPKVIENSGGPTGY